MNKLFLKFENYKLFGNKELEINPDANIVIVQGDNETGKTSIINAIKEAYTVSRITDEPLKEGTNEGKFSIDILDKNGEPITIVYQFWSDKSSQFYAIKNGKKINTIKEIREIIGTCTIFSVPDISYKLRNAESRKKVIEEIIKPVAGPEKIVKLQYYEAKIKTVFDERREIGRELKSLESTLQKVRLTPEEESALNEYDKLIESKKNYEVRYNELKVDFDKYEQLKVELQNAMTTQQQELNSVQSLRNFKKTQLEKFDNEIAALEEKLKSLKEERAKLAQELDAPVVLQSEAKVEKVKNALSTMAVTIETNKSIYEFLKSEINKIDEKLAAFESAKIKSSSLKPIKEEYARVNQLYIEKDNELESLRAEQKKFISELNLPSGMSIEDDTIKIDGLPFDETQISESTMSLALVELLCKVNTSRFIAAGKYSDYNRERLEKLVEIAKKYNKQIYLENVVSGQQESDVRFIVNNDMPNYLGNNALNLE